MSSNAAAKTPATATTAAKTGFCTAAAAAAAEEVGLQFAWKNTKTPIGVKRWGGYFCVACQRSLLASTSPPDVRAAAKKHVNACTKCKKTFIASESKAWTAVASFDWLTPPNTVPRPRVDGNGNVISITSDVVSDASAASATHSGTTSPAAAPAAATEGGAARPAAAGDAGNNDGLIVDQYGQTVDAITFWNHVVDPCPIQLYDRIQHVVH